MLVPVDPTYSGNMERSEREIQVKTKRKRRRRSTGKGRVNTLSTLISPITLWDNGASSAEDADNSSTSSFEVKENHDDVISHLDLCDPLRKYHPSNFYTTYPIASPRALKRKRLSLVDGKDQNYFTCKRSTWAVTQKNALVQLNELRPGLRFEITSKTGPIHAPVFSVGVEVNGFHFEGRGPTKKKAKMRAAELALRSFIQFPNATQAHAAMGDFTHNSTVDFTADIPDFHDALLKDLEPSSLLHCTAAAKNEFFFSSIYNHRRLVRFTLDLVSSTNPKRRAFSGSFLEHFSPVALLNELRPGLRYMCLTERVHGKPVRRFVMIVRVEGRVFEGCAHSKRLAKAQAAAAALQVVYSLSLGPERNVLGLQGSTARNQLPQFFSESICRLVREKHSELTDGFSASQARHKVLAGIVMTRGFDLRSAQVVSLATGTKCLDWDNIPGSVARDRVSNHGDRDSVSNHGDRDSVSNHGDRDSVSNRGDRISDAHAEVMSRRALVRFLYDQLELLLCEPEGASIFVSNQHGGLLRLRDGVLFHMFISSSPCGDARLNCPYETNAAYPSRRLRCGLRVKVIGGEGTLPVTTRANQKRPHVSMSCTDKIAKWSAVGLQGSLLSRLVEPVYLHSVTVGTLSHTGHMTRAMTRRLATLTHLPFPYRRQQLLLGCLNTPSVRPVAKSCSLSVNWTLGDSCLEQINSVTGQREDSGPSRLCRQSLFNRWYRTQQQILGVESSAGTYSGCKAAAGRYQRAKQQFSSSVQAAGLGTWARKHPGLSAFSVTV